MVEIQNAYSGVIGANFGTVSVLTLNHGFLGIYDKWKIVHEPWMFGH